MADFPRDKVPTKVTDLDFGVSALVATSQSNRRTTRTIPKAGVSWQEVWSPVDALEASLTGMLAKIEYFRNQQVSFNVKHLTAYGSGLSPNGEGAAGVTVSGADQTGDSIDLTGFTANQSPAVAAGDVFTISGISRVLKCREDANADGSGNATVKLTVPIFVGDAPADGASVTLTDVTITAQIDDLTPASQDPDRLHRGFTVRFVEKL